MVSVGKLVDGLEGLDPIAGSCKLADVLCLGKGVARDVEDSPRPQGEEVVDGQRVEPCAGRVDDDGVWRCKRGVREEAGQNLADVPLEEGAVSEAVLPGVFFGVEDGFWGKFDADDFFGRSGGCHAEGACAAVEVEDPVGREGGKELEGCVVEF